MIRNLRSNVARERGKNFWKVVKTWLLSHFENFSHGTKIKNYGLRIKLHDKSINVAYRLFEHRHNNKIKLQLL